MELIALEELTLSASAKDSIPLATETNLRNEALVFVLELAFKVRVTQPVVAMAQLLVHKVTLRQFTYTHSFRRVDKLRVAAACLFLSCKINEQIRTLSAFSQAYFDIERGKRLKKNPEVELPPVTDLMRLKLTDDIINLESQLLRVIDFNVGLLEVPYQRLKVIIRSLELDPNTANYMQTVAWNFATDSFRSQACLVYPMDEVAAVCVKLAAEYMDVQVHIEVQAGCLEMLIRQYERVLT